MSCGITLDISRREMFLPIQVLVPAPKGTGDFSIRMKGRSRMGWQGLTVIGLHLLQLLLVIDFGVPSLRTENIGVRTEHLRVTMGYPSVDAHYCLLYPASSAFYYAVKAAAQTYPCREE